MVRLANNSRLSGIANIIAVIVSAALKQSPEKNVRLLKNFK
jgi:hypothetical protein